MKTPYIRAVGYADIKDWDEGARTLLRMQILNLLARRKWFNDKNPWELRRFIKIIIYRFKYKMTYKQIGSRVGVGGNRVRNIIIWDYQTKVHENEGRYEGNSRV